MRKYHLTNRFKILFGSIWLSPLLLIIPLCVLFYAAMPTKNWVFISILIIAAEILCAVYMTYSEYIVLSENGIIYHTELFTVQSNWSDIETISSDRWWFFKQELLIANDPEVKMKSLTSSAFVGIARSMNPKRLIPLGCFSDNWRNSELGQQIKQYAPHLFEKEKSAQSA